MLTFVVNQSVYIQGQTALAIYALYATQYEYLTDKTIVTTRRSNIS